ncbi:26S proteasome non-ATPase regulatory subunit 8 [Ixodes scapularis]
MSSVITDAELKKSVEALSEKFTEAMVHLEDAPVLVVLLDAKQATAAPGLSSPRAKSVNDLPESAYKYQLLGLNLLCLLAQNRVAEFHTELELLPAKEIQSNVYISHPVSMEQFLMEGSYNKVFLSKGNVPSPSYTFFTDILLDTVRDEIASCVEKAYERISGPDVTRMLFLEAPRQTAAYATKRGWTQASNTYQFSTEVKHTDDVIPTEDLAAQTIGYARELEMIV